MSALKAEHARIDEAFLQDIDHVAVLRHDETLALIRQHRDGDAAAMGRIVEGNIRLVLKIARKWAFYVPVDDLIGEGTLGLMRAVEKFDLRRKVQFSTYAYLWIEQRIRRFVACRDVIWLPRETLTKLSEVARDAALRMMWQPTFSSLHAGNVRTDIDAVDDASVIERTDDEVARRDAGAFAAQQIQMLDPRAQDMVRRYFGVGCERQAIRDIAARHGVSKQRVDQIVKKSLARMRKQIQFSEAVG